MPNIEVLSLRCAFRAVVGRSGGRALTRLAGSTNAISSLARIDKCQNLTELFLRQNQARAQHGDPGERDTRGR